MRDGYHPVIIGKRDHAEVLGLTGDLDAFDVVLHEDDVRRLAERPRNGIAVQTTQPLERVLSLVALIRQRLPESDVRFVDTVCQPTKQRQQAAIELAKQCDVVIVIGGAHSNNTCQLVNTCRQDCPRVHQVETAPDVCSAWLDGAEVIWHHRRDVHARQRHRRHRPARSSAGGHAQRT